MTQADSTILCIGKNGQMARALKRVGDAQTIAIHFAGRDEMDLMKEGIATRYIADLRPDIIINTAAYTMVDKAETEPDIAQRLNCDAGREIANSAAKIGARLIHLSTDYVFSGTKNSPYLPEDATDPHCVYGLTKRAGEQAVLMAYPKALIVRTSWIFSQNSPNFVRTMLKLAQTNPTVRVVDDQVGCPTFADDLAVGLLALSSLNGPCGIVHLAGEGAASWAQLAGFVFEMSAKMGGPSANVEPIATAQYPTAASRPFNSQLDSSRMSDIYGITLPHWHSGVRDCLEQISETGWVET
jgi:dTDP-4-dehydrorhamnose reductase